ncbi:MULTISPECIES: hypothetical protein [Salinibaculum]|uniref:hypothetical protein n=1 Tax=Salinibaculum TaxID=2732368 RepID=UPI0030CDAFD2
MVDSDLGTATIVYEDPHEGTVETTVQNEHIAYFQDHWILRRGEDASGNDLVRRIPVERVHYVERSVTAFEDEVGTLRNQVESVAEDLRTRFFGGRSESETEGQQPIEVEVETEEEGPAETEEGHTVEVEEADADESDEADEDDSEKS